jgi:phage/plasmid-associated DNA primase
VLYQDEGLNPPDKVLAATKEYKAEQDKFGQFITERLVEATDNELKMSEVVRHWKLWCESQGAVAFGARRVKDQRVRRGYTIERLKENQDWLIGYAIRKADVYELTSRL